MSTLVTFIMFLVVVGILLYIIQEVVPMPQPFRNAIHAIVCLFLVLWLLKVLGLWNGLGVRW